MEAAGHARLVRSRSFSTLSFGIRTFAALFGAGALIPSPAKAQRRDALRLSLVRCAGRV